VATANGLWNCHPGVWVDLTDEPCSARVR
jgi:hypothetical protein